LTPDPLILLRKVHKTYPRGSETVIALDGVDLEIFPGDFLSVIGPSGSGKTTLFNIIGCLDTPSRGSVKIDGIDTADMEERDLVKVRRDKVGFIFQQFYLLPALTILDNIALPLLFKRQKPDREFVLSLAKLVGLSGRIRHKPHQLSGGEMQRVAVARALVNRPKILLADEPTGNLDLRNREILFDLLQSLNARGLTILVATHDLHMARRTKGSVGLMDGRIQPVRDIHSFLCSPPVDLQHARGFLDESGSIGP